MLGIMWGFQTFIDKLDFLKNLFLFSFFLKRLYKMLNNDFSKDRKCVYNRYRCGGTWDLEFNTWVTIFIRWLFPHSLVPACEVGKPRFSCNGNRTRNSAWCNNQNHHDYFVSALNAPVKTHAHTHGIGVDFSVFLQR